MLGTPSKFPSDVHCSCADNPIHNERTPHEIVEETQKYSKVSTTALGVCISAVQDLCDRQWTFWEKKDLPSGPAISVQTRDVEGAQTLLAVHDARPHTPIGSPSHDEAAADVVDEVDGVERAQTGVIPLLTARQSERESTDRAGPIVEGVEVPEVGMEGPSGKTQDSVETVPPNDNNCDDQNPRDDIVDSTQSRPNLSIPQASESEMQDIVFHDIVPPGPDALEEVLRARIDPTDSCAREVSLKVNDVAIAESAKEDSPAVRAMPICGDGSTQPADTPAPTDRTTIAPTEGDIDPTQGDADDIASLTPSLKFLAKHVKESHQTGADKRLSGGPRDGATKKNAIAAIPKQVRPQQQPPDKKAVIDADEEPLGWTQVMDDPTLGDGLHEHVDDEEAVVDDGVNRLLPPFHLENLSQILPNEQWGIRSRVNETTHIVRQESPFLFPLSAPDVPPDITEIHLPPESESDESDSEGIGYSQAISTSWRRELLPQVDKGVTEKREHIVFHESLIKTLQRRSHPEKPPYSCMLRDSDICTSRMPDWNREPTLCHEAAKDSPITVLMRTELIVELLKHK